MIRDIIKFAIDTNVSQGINVTVYHGVGFTPEEIKYAYEAYCKAFPELKSTLKEYQ